MVLRAVSNSGWSYHCEDMVRAVNYFRHLGKDQSLNVLRSSLRAPESKPIQVILLCRLLFVNTNDWQLPRLGKPVPTLFNPATEDVGTEVTNLNGRIQETFPLFPFALSKNVPFLVIEGYSTGGVLELPGDVIKECGSLPIISSDLPNTDYEAAAHALVETDAFRKLYPNRFRRERMTQMILKQALHTNANGIDVSRPPK